MGNKSINNHLRRLSLHRIMKEKEIDYFLLFWGLTIIALFALGALTAKSQSRIKAQCPNRTTSMVEIDRNGDISYIPCEGKANVFFDSTIKGIINGKAYQNVSLFNAADYNSINSVSYSETTDW